MFTLRGIAVSLTSFVLLYCLLSLLVVCAWRCVMLVRGLPARAQANLLFGLRIFPLVASACLTLVFVVPAYVRLEPRSIEEDMGLPLALGLGCLLLFAIGSFRVIAALAKSSRVVASWMDGARALDTGVIVPTFQANHDAPPLTLAGVCSPTVLISEATVTLLSIDELRVAVRHEVAHMTSRDNLKKLAFHCSPFPGMTGLESTWQETAEIAADDGAVASLCDALDLAAALIKLSRLIPPKASPAAFTMALLNPSASVRFRVERLLAWNENKSRTPLRWHFAVPLLLATVLCASALYSDVLAHTHRITEWLVR